MSILYKDNKDITVTATVEINRHGIITIDFSADCGKFGTDECIDSYTLSAKELLEILQKNYHEPVND